MESTTTERRGALRKLAGGWEARIRIDTKVRLGFDLTTIDLDDEPAAIERCSALALMATRLRKAGHAKEAPKLLEEAAKARAGKAWNAVVVAIDALVQPGGTKAIEGNASASVTFGDLAKDWTTGKLHARYPGHVDTKRTSDHDALRLAKWIFPVLEHVPLHAVTVAHAEEILRRIPAAKSRATCRHVAQLMTRVLNLAVYPCKHIERSPLPKGFMPKLGKQKALAYLYPDEDRALVSHAGTDDAPGVPVINRLFYGFLAREGLRCEEALSLTWAHVDLKRGSIRVDVNKTDDPRTWALDPGVVRALQWWKEQHPDDKPDARVFRAIEAPTHMAMALRAHLQLAGVNRAELFERSEARRQIRCHDLRATFITVNLANGKTEAWIADRTGHTTSAMINRYRRASRTHAELGQGTLAPLHEALGVAQSRPTALSSDDTSADLSSDIPSEVAYAVIANAALRSSNPLGDAAFPDTSSQSGPILGQAQIATPHDPVEAALASALTAAATAGRFDVVAQLARELEARRLAREPNVIGLDAKRGRR